MNLEEYVLISCERILDLNADRMTILNNIFYYCHADLIPFESFKEEFKVNSIFDVMDVLRNKEMLKKVIVMGNEWAGKNKEKQAVKGFTRK